MQLRRPRFTLFETLEDRCQLAGDIAGTFGDVTTLVAELNQEAPQVELDATVDFRGATYFTTYTDDVAELWKTDGQAGTERIKVLSSTCCAVPPFAPPVRGFHVSDGTM